MPPLKSLQVFLSAARHKSFKAAAEELFVTQAAVSQQIRILENHFSTPLFIRKNKQTHLSAQGIRLFPFIENAFEQIKLGVHAVTGEPNANELKVSALHSVTSLLLLPNIHHFQQENSEICVQFAPNNNLETFMQNGIDIAIRRGFGDYLGLVSRKLIDDEIVLVASSLLVGVDSQVPTEIFKLPLLEDTSSDIQEAISDCCQQFHIERTELHSTIRTTDALPIIQNVLAGQGIAFVSRALVNHNIKMGQLVNVFDYAYASSRALFLVAPEHHFNWPKVQRFEQWAKALFIS